MLHNEEGADGKAMVGRTGLSLWIFGRQEVWRGGRGARGALGCHLQEGGREREQRRDKENKQGRAALTTNCVPCHWSARR